MSDERIDDYLRGLDDAAADYRPEWDDRHALSCDEWNARRVADGQAVGTMAEYIESIRSGEDHV